MIRFTKRLGRFALVLAVAFGAGSALRAQSSGQYPYRATAPEGYRGSNVTTPAPIISPSSVSGAARGRAAPGADAVPSSGSSGAGLPGGYPLPSFLKGGPSARPLGQRTSEGPDNAAHLWLRVPAEAQVWVDGVRTRQTGERRHYFSPPLTPGKKYSYEVRVRWMKDGKPVEREQRIAVHAGADVRYDFTRPPSESDEKTTRAAVK